MKHAIGFSRLRCLTAAVMMACCASVFAAKMDTAGVAPTAKALPKPIEQVPHSGFDVAAVQQAVVRDMPGETVAVRDDAVQMAIGGGPRAGGALVYDCSDPGISSFQPLGCPGPGGGSGTLWADDITLDAAGTRDLNHFDTMITCGVTGAVATGYSLDLELWEDIDSDGLPDTAIAGTACSFTLPDPPVGTTQTNTIFTCDRQEARSRYPRSSGSSRASAVAAIPCLPGRVSAACLNSVARSTPTG